MHHRDLNDRGKFDLLLQLVDLKLRAQTLGLDLRAAMLPVKRMPREHEHLGEHGSPICVTGYQSRLRPSPRRPPAPVPTIPAWAPCLRPLTRSTALQGCISLIVRIRRARKPTMPCAGHARSHCADLCPDLCPTRCQSYGAPGLHGGHCRTKACSKDDHSDCGFIAAHAAADCPTASPPSCRFYVAGARCAYGARAPERVPAVPPALALPALDLAERARAERERDLAERKLLHAHCVPTPGIYDDFEANPASALLLLAHNTNLGSFPALQRVQGLRRRRRARWHRLQAQEKGQLVQAKGSSLREHRVLTHDY